MLDFEGLPQWFLEQLPGYFLWKDKESRYLGGNLTFAHLVGFKNTDELPGLYDADMKCEACQYADIWVEQDQQVLASEKPITVIETHIFAGGEIKALISHKNPLYDKNRELSGVQFYANSASDLLHEFCANRIEMDRKWFPTYLPGQRRTYNVVKKIPFGCLTQRESESLYYLMRGKSAREIGEIFSRSPKTIERHIQSIKSKLDCQSKGELIEKSIDMDLLQYVPLNILKKFKVKV